MDSPSATTPNPGYGARAFGMSTLGRQRDEMERGEMSDSTDPPTDASNVVAIGSTNPPPEHVYVCGARNDKCVCIEDHHATTGNATSDKTWHVCYQCGDEWYT